MSKYIIEYPDRQREMRQAEYILLNGDDYLIPPPPGSSKRRTRRAPNGYTFPEVLGFILGPDQLEWTAQQVQDAAEGLSKIIRLAIPKDDLATLRRHNAVALPIELTRLCRTVDRGAVGQAIGGTFRAPLSQLSNVSSFNVPLEWAAPVNRPKTELGGAFTRQLLRVADLVEDHEKRLAKRVKDYMFGRPLATPRQRVLSAAMEAYPEFDWRLDILPYLQLVERKTDNGDTK